MNIGVTAIVLIVCVFLVVSRSLERITTLRGVVDNQTGGRNLQSYPPSGYCLSEGSTTCNQYSGCMWVDSKCILRTTSSPTQATFQPSTRPTTPPTASPTAPPTKAPTRKPTAKPTTIAQKKKATKAPTRFPTRVATKPPIPIPDQVTIPNATGAPNSATGFCVYPTGIHCEQVRSLKGCNQFNGCSWAKKKKKCIKRAKCPPYAPAPTVGPSQSRVADCVLPPSGGCVSLKSAAGCLYFSGCNWNASRKLCSATGCVPLPPSFSPVSSSPTTGAPSSTPSLAPTITTYAPGSTRNPTKSPSRAPTSKPTLPKPTAGPTLSPTTGRTRNPTPLQTLPTPFPTANNFPLICDTPVEGCGSLATSVTCNSFNGCNMVSGSCQIKPTCSGNQFTCGTTGATFHLSSNMLPACLRADAQNCDRQRQDVYDSLGLTTVCGDSGMIPCLEGGCTLRLDLLQAEQFEELVDFYRMEVFVHPVLGVDSGVQRGDRSAPVRSIEYALTRSRVWTGYNRRIVLMGPAIHRPNGTILLSTNDSQLTFYGENGAVVSGALQVDLTWRSLSTTNPILVADIPRAVSSKLEKLAPMFINGEPAIRARYPNLNSYWDKQYASGNRLSNWRKRSNTPPLLNRIGVKIGTGLFNTYNQAQSGSCDGVFDPPIGFFCEPSHQADGGCPYTIPQGVDLDAKVAASLNYDSWDMTNVHLHTFHPLRWGLWTFQLADLPTPAPTSQRPSNAPTSSRPTRSPTRRPSGSPTTSRPTKSPITSAPTKTPTVSTKKPSAAPTPTAEAPSGPPVPVVTPKPTTKTPTVKGTTGHPTKAPTSQKPTTSPSSSRPTSSPTNSPTIHATEHPSFSPTRSPTFSTLRPSSSPTQTPSAAPSSSPPTTPVAGKPNKGDRRRLQVAAGSTSTMMFEKGGWQEARGDCGDGGGDWFVENAFQLLDSPNEFYLDLDDPTGAKIYYWPNVTDVTLPTTSIEFGFIRDIFRTAGSTADPVADVHFRHLYMEKTYPTHMDGHEVPSGGDWTVHRGGAIVLEGVVNSSVYDCHFHYLGGNGIFVSRYARDLELVRNEFRTLGSSAILLVGDPLFSAPEPWNRVGVQDHIERVLIEENVASELGMIIKQSSGVFLALSRSIMIRRNIIYNVARAGIVFNDGFGGNNTITNNIMFNTVMETLDHGPFNVWDRQRWIQDSNLNPSNYPFTVENNLIIGNNNGAKGIDLDDGSRYYAVANNVVINGLQKFKGNNIVATGNLLFPTVYGCVWMTPVNFEPAAMNYQGNTCVSASIEPYYFNLANAAEVVLCRTKNFISSNNQFIGTNMRKAWNGCGVSSLTWSTWLNTYKQDAGTQIFTVMPTQSQQANMVMDKLTSIFGGDYYFVQGRFSG